MGCGWAQADGRTQAGRKTSVMEEHGGTRRGENVHALATDDQKKIPDVGAKKENLNEEGAIARHRR